MIALADDGIEHAKPASGWPEVGGVFAETPGIETLATQYVHFRCA